MRLPVGQGLADRIGAACLWAGGALVAAITVLTVADVAMRYLFAAPIRGVIEVVQLALPLIVFLGVVLISRDRQHISVTLLEPLLGPRMRRVYRGVNLIFTAAGAALVSAILLRVAGDFLAWGQTSLVLRLDLWPLVSVLSALAFLAAVVALIGPRGDGPEDGR